MTRPIAVDLFSGAGGLSLGFEQAGFDVACAVEADARHAAVHEYNFPSTAVLQDDIRNVTGRAIRGQVARSGPARDDVEIEVLVGGPPCQGFSDIGRRDLSDDRNNLIFEFARLVDELRPRFFVMENVPGLITRGRSLFERLVEELTSYGYAIPPEPWLLDAARYGVPQRRLRLFLVGSRDRETLPEEPPSLTRPAGEVIDTDLRVGPSVSDAIDDLPITRESVAGGRDELELTEDDLDHQLKAASGYAKNLLGASETSDDFSHGRIWDGRWLTNVALATHSTETMARFRATTPGSREPVSRFPRLDRQGSAYTIRAGTGTERGAHTAARPIHPSGDRVITVREAARLHSFPDWFRFHRTQWRGFQEVGNSVPPLLARSVATSVISAMAIEATRPVSRIALGSPTLLGGERVNGLPLDLITPAR